MRESSADALEPEGGSINHDVSVPVSSIPAFMEEAGKAVTAAIPEARICAFGHLGDGNIHYNISQPVNTDPRADMEADKRAFLARWRDMNEIVHAIVLSCGGSISAEPGLGQFKRDELARIRPAIANDLIRRPKPAFDPHRNSVV